MRLKLDENLGARSARILQDGGCDVSTIHEQALGSASDDTVIEVCRVEERVLITLDKDFAQVLRYPPARYPGIVVLRLPEPVTLLAIHDALRRLVAAARDTDLAGRLWIIDAWRIRQRCEPEP